MGNTPQDQICVEIIKLIVFSYNLRGAVKTKKTTSHHRRLSNITVITQALTGDTFIIFRVFRYISLQNAKKIQ